MPVRVGARAFENTLWRHMPFFVFAKWLRQFPVLRSSATPVVVVAFVFVTSWPLMALAEPAGSPLVQPNHYWWYFLVTASTVGYGDLYPTTSVGHIVGVYVIVGGIVTLTTMFTKMASALEEMRGRRMQGAITSDGTGHVVLLGYHPGRTERMVSELLADGMKHMVIAAWDEVSSHPLPQHQHRLDFVRGELTDEDVLRRTGVHRAHVVLVDARDDNEALAVAVLVAHLSTHAHKVVALRDLSRAALVRHVDATIRCVQWHSPRMITEEMTSPGITEVYAELMSARGRANTYSITLPGSLGPVLVEHCQTGLGRKLGAILIATRNGDSLTVNPDWRTELAPGAVLYYVSPRPITTAELVQALRPSADSTGLRASTSKLAAQIPNPF